MSVIYLNIVSATKIYNANFPLIFRPRISENWFKFKKNRKIEKIERYAILTQQ